MFYLEEEIVAAFAGIVGNGVKLMPVLMVLNVVAHAGSLCLQRIAILRAGTKLDFAHGQSKITIFHDF